jgi:hypothetical protein
VFLYEASSDVIQEHTRYQAARFEVCLSFAIGTLSKHRLCLTHACLIHFLGVCCYWLCVCGMIQYGIYVYNIHSSYYVVIFSREMNLTFSHQALQRNFHSTYSCPLFICFRHGMVVQVDRNYSSRFATDCHWITIGSLIHVWSVNPW